MYVHACDDGFLNWQLLTFSALISPLQPSHSNLISFVLHVVFFIVKMHRSLQDKADFRYAVMLGMISGTCTLFTMSNIFAKKCPKFEKVNGLSVTWFSRAYTYIYRNVNKMFCLSCWRWCKPCFEDFLFMYYTTWKVSVKCRIINTEHKTTWRN